ncbi:hypothetical protein [Paraburkholderia saeva]|uniref:hypothetical protein n=1 Tax=Paraburkholderia saeva TaxID=2777537 RepID=UPI001E4C1EAE|nr:hypothetical protein [Paraburkholderia saeva]
MLARSFCWAQRGENRAHRGTSKAKAREISGALKNSSRSRLLFFAHLSGVVAATCGHCTPFI